MTRLPRPRMPLLGWPVPRGQACSRAACTRAACTRAACLLAAWLGLASLLLGTGGCSGIGELGAAGSGPQLSSSEQSAVRSQVSAAMAAKRWKVAWNQEIEAGADRAQLQEIALAALADRSRHAGDMLAALHQRFGALPAAGRARVDGLVREAKSEGHWSRALDIELLSADDAPAFSQAWALYQDAPVERAPDLLEAIQEARADPKGD